MGSIWITEVAPPDDGSPIFGTPAHVIERTRSAPPDEADKRARQEDQDREQRQAAARERQADYADALRLRGIDPPTLGESISMRGAATFADQDRRDRIRDKQMAELVEQEGEERRLRGQVQRELIKSQAATRAALRQANDAHASRYAAEVAADRYRYRYASTYFRR
jgi:hypothetical protein